METLREDQIYGHGNGSIVYKLGDKKAVKVLRYHGERSDLASAKLEKEFQIASEAFELGLHCPQAYSVENFKICPSKLFYDKLDHETERPGIVMQFIQGRRLDRFFEDLIKRYHEGDKRLNEEYVEISSAHCAETEKAYSLGFLPFDLGFRNALISPERRIFLIDFEGWGLNENLIKKSQMRRSN